MPNVQSLRCKECGRDYPLEPIYVCDFCFGPLEVAYDYDAAAKNMSRESIQDGPPTIWRYDQLLPVSRENAVDIGAGMTPLLKADNLGRELGLNNLWIKNDAANPTHSFKDRVVSVAATKALEFEFDTIACASTGNLAGATAAHGAKAGMKTIVFLPADLERGKILGAAIFGSVVLVNGNYDQVNRLCSELGDDRHWAFVNINMRPYYSEGSKSLSFEIAEQLGWHAPEHIIVPVASGSQGAQGPQRVRPTGDNRRCRYEDAHRSTSRLFTGRDCVCRWSNPSEASYSRHHCQVTGDRQSCRWFLYGEHCQQDWRFCDNSPRRRGRRGDDIAGGNRRNLHRNRWRCCDFSAPTPGSRGCDRPGRRNRGFDYRYWSKDARSHRRFGRDKDDRAECAIIR